MTTCRETETLIVRAADGAPLTGDERATLERHLAACATCRTELAEQRQIAASLQARTATPVPVGFERRLADRLGDDQGMLGLANWRAWTAGLLPVAGGLVLMAYLGVGLEPADATDAAADAAQTTVYAATTPAGMFLQPSSTSDLLLEAVLTGSVPTAGEVNVR